MCWDVSVRNRCVCRLFGNGRFVLVGGLFSTLDLGKDGHFGEVRATENISTVGTSVIMQLEWDDGPEKVRRA